MNKVGRLLRSSVITTGFVSALFLSFLVGSTATGEDFPRKDGIYRTQRRTTLINSSNREVYDYLVFTKEKVFTITGGYYPEVYYVEQPVQSPPGAFISHEYAIKDQPAFIKKWLNDSDMDPPVSASYSTKRGSVSTTIQFQIDVPGNLFGDGYTINYQGGASRRGMTLGKSWLSDGRVTHTERLNYEFVPVPGGMGKFTSMKRGKQAGPEHLSKIRDLMYAVKRTKAQSLRNMQIRAYQAAGGGGDRVGSIRDDVRAESRAELALSTFVSKHGAKLIPALEHLANDSNSGISSDAKDQLRELRRKSASKPRAKSTKG